MACTFGGRDALFAMYEYDIPYGYAPRARQPRDDRVRGRAWSRRKYGIKNSPARRIFG